MPSIGRFPNSSCNSSSSLKSARYIPLRDRLVTLLPAWEVGIQTYTMGIRGSHDPDRWHTNLTQLGLPATRMEALVRNLPVDASGLNRAH